MAKKKEVPPVFELIKSLTKAEKRSFKLYVKRINEDGDAKFIQLFDLLDKMSEYSESAIQANIKSANRQQLANLKSHLYKQVLLVLRLTNLKYDVDIQLREKLDYIRLLYKKGLYDQSLKMLNNVKKIAESYRKNIFKLALLNYEKNIETQQVINLDEQTGIRLDKETKSYIRRIEKAQEFLTLALLMKGRFLRTGMVKSEKELEETKKYFEERKPKFDESKMSFSEKYNMCRAYYWYGYVTYDFEACCVYTEKWVNLFKENDLYKLRQSEYLKGLSRLLQSLFRVGDLEKFELYFEELIGFRKYLKLQIDGNIHLLLLRHQTIHELNLSFLRGDFSGNKGTIEALIIQVEKNKKYIDRNNLLVIYYKVAIMYFGSEEYEKCQHYLNQIINSKSEGIREDLRGFAHILSLIALYENADDEYLDSRIRSVYIYLKQQENLGAFNKIILKFIRKIPDILPQELNRSFEELRLELLQLAEDQYASKSLLYFDIISWLESKTSKKSFQEVVRSKRRS